MAGGPVGGADHTDGDLDARVEIAGQPLRINVEFMVKVPGRVHPSCSDSAFLLAGLTNRVSHRGPRRVLLPLSDASGNLQNLP